MVQFLKVSGFPISVDCNDDTSVVDKVDNYKSDCDLRLSDSSVLGQYCEKLT